MTKRKINHEDYPCVIDWTNYQNTHTELQCKCKDCGDIFIPELNIGFEYNGDYWHGNPLLYVDDFILKNGKTAKQIQEKDTKKILTANEYGITIHTIWEYDWINNNKETKNYIKSKLNE